MDVCMFEENLKRLSDKQIIATTVAGFKTILQHKLHLKWYIVQNTLHSIMFLYFCYLLCCVGITIR